MKDGATPEAFSSSHGNALGAILIVGILLAITFGGAYWWISSTNADANNEQWRAEMAEQYSTCPRYYNEEYCIQQVDKIFNKYCKEFDSC